MDAAIEYARKHALEALVITRGGETLACEYGDAFEARTPHALYSGTKSFWGPVALAAQSDGLLELDEPVASTVESWRDDPWKRRVTLRMLLALTAGFGFGGLGQRRADVRSRAGNDAQERTRNDVHLWRHRAAGFRRRARAQTRSSQPNAARLPARAHSTARRRRSREVAHPFRRYSPAADGRVSHRRKLACIRPLRVARTRLARRVLHGVGGKRALRPGMVARASARAFAMSAYASGAGGQALYLVPSLDAVIVRFGKSASFKHETFLKRLL